MFAYRSMAKWVRLAEHLAAKARDARRVDTDKAYGASTRRSNGTMPVKQETCHPPFRKSEFGS